MTNFETAVATLITAKTVEQWNELRDSVKHTVSVSELNKIDSGGLIVEVLGADVKI